MKKFLKVVGWITAALVVAFLVVPFLIPFESSGTKSYRDAAGADAEFVQAGGVDVHVEQTSYTGDCGCNAPLIILMHGFGASTYSWRDVIEPLSEYGEVLGYDRPAFGFTERPTEWTGANPYGFEGNFQILDDLITQFGAGRDVVLVGHSAGGQLAAEYARLNPTNVAALVLVDPAILTTGGTPSGLDWLWGIPQIDRLGPILVGGIASSGMDLLRESYADQSMLTDAVIAGYRAPLTVVGWEEGFWNFSTAPRTNELSSNLADVSMPVLLITGDADTVVPTADTVALNSMFAESRLAVIDGAGHLPQEEKPADFMVGYGQHWEWLVSSMNTVGD
jgi:pimeloyl-ACP methyl ester carboxylesterase